MKVIDKKLKLQKILLEEIISGKIDLLLEADPVTGTNPEDAKKAGETTVEPQEIAPQINDLVSKIKTADANLKKSQNDFVNVANNALNRAKASDGLEDPKIVGNNIASIGNKLVTTLTQNKVNQYKNLANRDSGILAIINLLNAEYERLTGKKLPAFNVNKILPGLMAAKAAGISIPSAPSQGTMPSTGSTGPSVAGSTTKPAGSLQEQKQLIKEIARRILKEQISLVRNKEVEIKPTSSNFDFEFIKNKLKSRDWNKRWEAINYARDILTELGQGTSRIAFLMPDGEQVLKIAKNEAGIAQNKQELEIFLNPSIPENYTYIYKWDKGHNWLLTEVVVPFNSNEDFRKEMGIKFDIFESLLFEIEKWNAKDLEFLKDIYRAILKKIKGTELTEREKKILELYKAFEEQNKKDPLKEYTEETIEKNIKNIDSILANEKAYKFFIRLVNLMQRGLIAGDFILKHFGISKEDNEIKLYDYGYSKDVKKKFYM